MKFLAAFALLIPTLAIGGERPASAPPIDERLTGIEQKNKGQDAEIAALKKDIDALRLAIRCPCTRGGKCICGEDCVCPKATASDWKPGEPTLKGVEVAFIGTTWCANCPPAENRLGSLKSQIHYIDADKSRLDERFGVSSYPTAVALVDGMVVSRCLGSDIGTLIVGDWLEKPVWTKPNSEAVIMAEVKEGKDTRIKIGESSDGSLYAREVKPSVKTYSAPRATYSAPRGNGPGHTHRCGRCGMSWSHENWNVGNPSAHTCPGCGSLTWGNRTEGWISRPTYRAVTQPARASYSPPVYFSSGYSSGYCPTGTCPR
jgi:hypothetical protein